jgi:hypothetical protein
MEEEGNKSERSRCRRLRGADGREGEKSGGESDPGLGGALIFWVGREGGEHPWTEKTKKRERSNSQTRRGTRERWKERGRERRGG